jgi:hypothetical protein
VDQERSLTARTRRQAPPINTPRRGDTHAGEGKQDGWKHKNQPVVFAEHREPNDGADAASSPRAQDASPESPPTKEGAKK